ncbi:hypothetical protein [Anaerosphaera multitolerans]|nr:hypothetical protein [Anaerosphaera multitolerans]
MNLLNEMFLTVSMIASMTAGIVMFVLKVVGLVYIIKVCRKYLREN